MSETEWPTPGYIVRDGCFGLIPGYIVRDGCFGLIQGYIVRDGCFGRIPGYIVRMGALGSSPSEEPGKGSFLLLLLRLKIRTFSCHGVGRL